MKKGEDYIGVTTTFLCHDGQGEVFLSKRSVNCRDEHGRWDCGGGSIEFGDTAEATVRKEIREEYGTEPLDIQFLGYRDVFREHAGRSTHWLSLDFRVLIRRDEARNNEPHKFDEVGWFRLDALPEPMHSQWPAFLEKYGHEL